ncbi:MAG: hypothetical protein Q8J98_05905 [Phaeovulum sp.]|uniref:hypothetical protein n=1 Tax=Phaeovulum sp. TaxID=2934796 RepID=UPI00273120A4|nr:hypothetical protein [Phaeovulum sp.]MDP2062626.1 hypothetical protein [Phaeovulum sp.]
MIVILGALVGALLGYWQAFRRGGNGLDRAQYSAVYAIIFAIIGMFATLAVDRLI